MTEAAERTTGHAQRIALPRLRIPLWDEYRQAERFAGVLALVALGAVVPYVVAERMVVVQLCVGIAAALLGLCTWSARGGPAWALGLGMPLVMTLGAAALLHVTGGTCVASSALLALAPPVAMLWSGSERVAWGFHAVALAIALTLLLLGPSPSVPGAEPWITDSRAPWIVPLIATPSFFFARSWTRAHGAWQEEVLAAHAVVAASEARFKAYVENAHDVTAELDGRGRLLFVSSRREPEYALPVAELLGTAGADYLHPDDRSAARATFEKAAAKGRSVLSEPIRYRGSREGWRYLRVAVSPYKTRDGRLRFIAQARDETALVEAQAERDRLIAQLEAALAQSRALLSQRACPHCQVDEPAES